MLRECPEVGIHANKFLRNKKQEWEEYRSEVTAFELRKMLPVL
ncbi:glutamine synthetase [Streptomyces rimosus subsp. rimosus]|nr:glutamine synthetase [Streptomyces rimosus subsp. rimosus]